MKSLQNRKSKSSKVANGTSSSCHGSVSIATMFKKQQEKWDARWALGAVATECDPTVRASETSEKTDRSRIDCDKNDVELVSKDALATNQKRLKTEELLEVSGATKSCDQSCRDVYLQADGSANRDESKSRLVSRGRLSLKRKRRSFVADGNTLNNLTASCPTFQGDSSKETIESPMHCCDSSELGHCDSIPNKFVLVNPESDLAKLDENQRSPLKSEGVDQATAENSSLEQSEEFSNRGDYYLENFTLILSVVMADDYYIDLFDDLDLATIDTFRNGLSEEARRLYVRLFLRKHKWLRGAKIVYPLISQDLHNVLSELTASGLLYDVNQMTSLEDAVACLPAPELKTLAKSLHINVSTKTTMSDAVVKHARNCDAKNFFGRTSGSTEKMIMKRCKSMLSECYKLADEKRFVFIRVMMLFGLHNTIGDDEAYGQQLIFQMLMTQIGRIKYPEYKILRKTRIYADRDSVVRYATALQLESEICEALEKKDYDHCLLLYLSAKEIAGAILNDKDTVKPFTSGAIYVRLLTHGVEVLQFLKKYDDAVVQLRLLLSQNVYHQDYRGRWYDRLALNLDFHLKQHLEAMQVIKEALGDESVRTGHRYNLFQRAKKIGSSAAAKKSTVAIFEQFKTDPMNSVLDAPTITITGQQMFRNNPGCSAIWITPGVDEDCDSESKIISRVEEVALRHYAQNGYPEGIHGEGSTFRCLFSLFMWEILFIDDIEDVFYNEYQTYPLDISSSSFFTNREAAITSRLSQIAVSSNEELGEIVCQTWNQRKDTLCLGMSWELFRDCDHAVGLVKCIGGSILAGIFERMARLMRSVTGGVPDLVVWNPDTLKFKVVEVKGPGDRLSSKQILWLDYLLRLSVDAEVCLVRAVGSKSIQR